MTATDKKQTVTFMVSECGEYHSMGEFHEGIKTIGEAKRIYEGIDPDRLHAIPAVGINIHTEGTPDYEDIEWDFYSGNIIDLTMLEYLPQVTGCGKAMMALAQIMEAFPQAKVYGKVPEKLEEMRESIKYSSEAYKKHCADRESNPVKAAHIRSKWSR